MDAYQPSPSLFRPLPPCVAVENIASLALEYIQSNNADYQIFGNKLYTAIAGLLWEYSRLQGPPSAHSQWPIQVAIASGSDSTSSTPPQLSDGAGSSDAVTTKPRGKTVVLDHEDIPLLATGSVVCQWGGCGFSIEAKDLYDEHLRADTGHLPNIPERGMVECRWTNCRTGPMKVGSLKRHILEKHLNACKYECGRCGAQKRADSYKSNHGPARLCRRKRVAPRVSDSLTSAPLLENTSFESSSSASPASGSTSMIPSGPAPMSLPGVPPVPSYPSAVGPVRQGSSRRRRAGQVQKSVAYPPVGNASTSKVEQVTPDVADPWKTFWDSYEPLPQDAIASMEETPVEASTVFTEMLAMSTAGSVDAPLTDRTCSDRVQNGAVACDGALPEEYDWLFPEEFDWLSSHDENRPPLPPSEGL
ncbi:hypothetical protein BD414DRAFT_540018 [Trametes punicea]|nr:hypothetical protein BD414DRAFT_540018 [Trametes punicea]